MDKYTGLRPLSLSVALALSACGSTDSNRTAEATATPTIHSCESIVPSIISLAADRTPSIVKIYKPELIGGTGEEPICKGKALMSIGSKRLPIYFRRLIDEDGDALVEYSGDPFPPTDRKPGN